jgi:non-ribosomal peptide synthetase component F
MSRPTSEPDPVRRRRANAERLARIASRTGYALITVAVVTFFVALVTEFDATMAAIITAALVAGCVLLAPAIILSYAVKAAEREDRDRGL